MQLLVLMKIAYFYNNSGGSQKWQKRTLDLPLKSRANSIFLQTTVS